MNTSSTRVIGIFTVLASLAAPGCKEDPPPPPPLPTATAEPRAAHPKAASGQVQRMSPEATKLYRVDMCFFGSQGLRHLSEAYEASLDGKPPSATNLPEFGDYPQPQVPPRIRAQNEAQREGEAAGDEPKKADEGATAKRKLAGKPDPAGKTGDDRRAMRPPTSAVRQVPFLKYLRYCAVAKQLKQPESAELTQALTAFDQYAAPLNRALVEATRYFGTEQFERDEFKRGTALHEKLSAELPKAGEELDKLAKGVESFKASLKALPDELDASGKIAQRAYDEARGLTLLFLAAEVDDEAVKAEIEKLKKSHAELVEQGKTDTTAPHPKVVAPKIEGLIAAAEAAIEPEGAPTTEQRYPVFIAMADLVENMQRALAQLLNKRRGGHPSTAAPPMRMLRPQLRGGERPRVAPKSDQVAE